MRAKVASATPPSRKEEAEVSNSIGAAVDAIRRWRAEPHTFVREVFGATPDPWQDDFLKKFPTAKRHGLVACKGPGKTTSLSWIGWNFMATRANCKVPCASITGDNLRDGLWTEFSKWQKKSDLLSRAFEWNKTRIFERRNPETWFASARTFAQDADPTQQANTLAGLHEDYLLWLLDEVSEMPDGVVSAAEAALTGGIETRMAIAGNCTRTDGPLYRAAVTDAGLWCITKITGDPDDPQRSPRIDIEECRRQIAKYGRDSYVVRVNILGEFPDRQADKLLDVADVSAAMERALTEDTYNREPKVIGVDPARFGDDASIFAPRQGRACFKMKEHRGLRTDELGDRLIAAIEKWGADAAFIDTTGVGAGVYDHCVNRGYGHIVHEVIFGGSATEPERFENKRAEIYWNAAEAVKGGAALPRDPLLAAELSAPIYWYDKKGRICLEAKVDIKKRIGRSPDRADAYVCTYASKVRRLPENRSIDEQHRARLEESREGLVEHDYDPIERNL